MGGASWERIESGRRISTNKKPDSEKGKQRVRILRSGDHRIYCSDKSYCPEDLTASGSGDRIWSLETVRAQISGMKEICPKSQVDGTAVKVGKILEEVIVTDRIPEKWGIRLILAVMLGGRAGFWQKNRERKTGINKGQNYITVITTKLHKVPAIVHLIKQGNPKKQGVGVTRHFDRSKRIPKKKIRKL